MLKVNTISLPAVSVFIDPFIGKTANVGELGCSVTVFTRSSGTRERRLSPTTISLPRPELQSAAIEALRSGNAIATNLIETQHIDFLKEVAALSDQIRTAVLAGTEIPVFGGTFSSWAVSKDRAPGSAPRASRAGAAAGFIRTVARVEPQGPSPVDGDDGMDAADRISAADLPS